MGLIVEGGLEQFKQRIKSVEALNNYPEDFRALLDHAVKINGAGGGFNFFDQGASFNAMELRDTVYSLADSLCRAGVKKGTNVAVMLPNIIEFPVTWMALGVLGAVQIAVNNRFTPSELAYQFSDADAEFLVVSEDYLDRVNEVKGIDQIITKASIITVSENKSPKYTDWQTLVDTGDSSYRPSWAISGDDLSSIQYTSGSTGLPKGCMLSQRSWLLFGCQAIELSDCKIANIMADHSFFYVDPQWQTVSALYAGACLHVPATLSSSKFVERLKKYKIDLSLFPRPIVGEKGEQSDRDTGIKRIYAPAAGAEGMRNIRRRFGCVATDGYGMTEIGGTLIVPGDVDDPELDSCVGVPAPFRECRVVREDGSDCGIDEIGELWVRGAGILTGYYNKPEATAEAFSGSWFRTGDLFVINSKGYFKIVGRIKDMIRRSSENISALEVEQALTMVEGVKQAAAVAIADDYRGEEVKAYLLLEEGVTPDLVTPQQVIDACGDKLAAYKIPRYIEYVSEFPYTPSQKVAKAKLDLQDLSNTWDALADA